MKNQETQIVLNHNNGSKAGSTSNFKAKTCKQITLGRSSSCTITFDPDADDMVSRHHATIKPLKDGSLRYQISDENSSNGVLVNGRKIKGLAILVPGDEVQLGRKGPQFSFDLTPRPDALLGATKLFASTPAPTSAATKLTSAERGSNQSAVFSSPLIRTASAMAAALFIAVVLFASISWKGADVGAVQHTIAVDTSAAVAVVPQTKAPSKWTAADIASKYQDAVVYINNSWKLVNTQGKQMYHRHVLVEDGANTYVYPCYVQNGQGAYEPYIEDFDYQGYSKPIGGAGGGSGFVVSEDGFIMTNKHVSAPWSYSYSFGEEAFPGLAVNGVGELLVDMSEMLIPVKQAEVGPWIPTEAYIGSLPQGKLFEGEMVYQDVIFANRTGRHPARVTRVSEVHDVAMLKVDVGTKLTALELKDTYNTIKPGDQVTILGYPSLTPKGEKVEAAFGPGSTSKVRIVPNLTINQGMVSAIHKGSTNFDMNSLTRSQFGDSYQLNINSAGSGNSGGPMFDEYGRVVGIYFMVSTDYQNTISFAVPIKYGLQLQSL